MVTFQTFAPTAKTLNATYFSSINATAASADLPGFRLRVRWNETCNCRSINQTCSAGAPHQGKGGRVWLGLRPSYPHFCLGLCPGRSSISTPENDYFSFGPHIYHLIFQITLFLASILMWGVCMLAYLNTPTKFDDPKGPRYLPKDEITWSIRPWLLLFQHLCALCRVSITRKPLFMVLLKLKHMDKADMWNHVVINYFKLWFREK